MYLGRDEPTIIDSLPQLCPNYPSPHRLSRVLGDVPPHPPPRLPVHSLLHQAIPELHQVPPASAVEFPASLDSGMVGLQRPLGPHRRFTVTVSILHLIYHIAGDPELTDAVASQCPTPSRRLDQQRLAIRYW